MKVVSEAMQVAGVTADDITLVEGHGTGTALGDPVEVTALTNVYRRYTDRTGYCALGSLKANIGHLDTAAGIASFVKAVLRASAQDDRGRPRTTVVPTRGSASNRARSTSRSMHSHGVVRDRGLPASRLSVSVEPIAT